MTDDDKRRRRTQLATL